MTIDLRPAVLQLCLAAVLGAGASACRDAAADEVPEPMLEQPSAKPGKRPPIAADLIAYAGHGGLFDTTMAEIEVDTELVLEMQGSMLDLLEAGPTPAPAGAEGSLAKARALLAWADLSDDERIVIQHAVIATWLRAPKAAVLAEQYAWRNHTLMAGYATVRPEIIDGVREAVGDLVASLGYPMMPEEKPAPATTDYIERCRANQVPIPPDWQPPGNPPDPARNPGWTYQGALTDNLLRRGRYAGVWTYTDPRFPGACIALPRDDGGAGTQMGIICQSANTGAACFWDNLRRGATMAGRLHWAEEPIAITALQDGSNLDEVCTGCHRGNNVFNIAPDDPTWRRVLGTDDHYTPPPTLVTNVRASADLREWTFLPSGVFFPRFRYIPITAPGGRGSAWENPYRAPAPGSPCVSCHEQPTGAVRDPMPMPPLCGTACYR